MNKTVKIGFVGVGNMGQCAHLRNYASLPGCEVVALTEPRPQLAQRVAHKYGVPRVYDDVEAMMAAEQLDGLVAPQPFQRHGELVAPLYRFGLPVLTEKPLAHSVAIAERMLAELKAGGSWHMVGYHKRCDPATVYAKAEIERLKASGELGKLRYIRVIMPSGDWIANGFYDLLTSDEPLPPGAWDAAPGDMDAETFQQYGSFVNYYIHQVNLIRHLLGEPYRVTYAEPSGVLLALQSESGIAGTLEMTPYASTLDWQESALVAFEKGYVKIELPAPVAINRPGRVEIFRDPGNGKTPETLVPQMPWDHAMRGQAQNFVGAIRGDNQPACQAAEALQDLQIARDYVRLHKASQGGVAA